MSGNKKTPKEKIDPSWLKDDPPNIESLNPVLEARAVLWGSWPDINPYFQKIETLKDWNEPRVKDIAKKAYEFFIANGIADHTLDMFMSLTVEMGLPLDKSSKRIHYVQSKNPLFTDITSVELLSVLILSEAFNGNPIVALQGANLLVKLKNIPDPNVFTRRILERGRKLGTEKNKEKAETRASGLRDAAIYKFTQEPACTYDDVVGWIKSELSLKRYITYKSDSVYSDRTIKDKIKGTKNIALQKLKK